MSKGARIRAEYASGVRKPNGTRWADVPVGMRLVIPTFAAVQMGQQPFVIPISDKKRFKQAPDPKLVGLPPKPKQSIMGGFQRGSNRTPSQAEKRRRRKRG